MSATDQMFDRALAYLDRKYVARADQRQQAMGLAYITAERRDFANEMVKFTLSEQGRALIKRDHEGAELQ